MTEQTADFIGEDGLDNRLASSWKLRLKREKARHRAKVIQYTAAVKASKVQ